MENGATRRIEDFFGELVEPPSQGVQFEPGQLVVSAEQCVHFNGGSEFDRSLRLRRLKEISPESYIELENQLQELAGRFVRQIPIGNFKASKKYISTVLSYRDYQHRKRILGKLRERLPRYPGDLFIWSDEGDHIHFVHDCPCSNGSCRCSVFEDEDFRGTFRASLRARKFINELDRDDWYNVLLYFLYSKWPMPNEVWIRRRLQRSPGADENLQWKNLCEFARKSILEGEAERVRRNSEEEQSASGSVRSDILPYSSIFDPQEGSSRQETIRGGKRKRSSTDQLGRKSSKFNRMLQEIEVYLDRMCVIPPNHIKELLHGNDTIEWHNPSNLKNYESSCAVWSMKFNRWSFLDLYNFYMDKEPIFYANDINPFVYYHTRYDSFNYIVQWLQFQFNDCVDSIRDFLYNILLWFNKIGWNNNPKLNGLCIVGPPNSGKNYFFDMFAALACNVGHIGRVNNKTNQFALQDIVNKRLVIGNEISMEEGAKEDMKKVLEGTACNVRVKFQGDKIFTKTPVLLISNFTLDICGDPMFKDVRLKTMFFEVADFLKDSMLKPYPLCLFDVYKHYNIDIQ